MANTRKYWTNSTYKVTELGETLRPHVQNGEMLWPCGEPHDIGRMSYSRIPGPQIHVLLAK